MPLSPNLLRGAFGSALKNLSEAEYARFFAPKATGQGPSGFRDPPRPFVLRVIDAGEIGMNVFVMREPALDAFIRAMRDVHAFSVQSVAGCELLQLPLVPTAASISRLRVHFLTATDIKGAGTPEFGVLLSRIRDRVSALRQLYGDGPLDMDFKAFGERACRVRMTRCDLVPVSDSRLSRATGQRHSLGGFTGICEYEGELAEFVPYLEIARWIGVGRQTVWGKGELSYAAF